MKKVFLITGASRGLGRHITYMLDQANHRVYAGMRNPISLAKSNAIPIKLDLTRENSLTTTMQTIIDNEGKIDVLIHNAGVAYLDPVDNLTSEEAQHVFAVNFFGPIRLTQLALPYMRKRKQGQLIFISSIRGIESHAHMGIYAASKAALEAVAFDWAATLAPWNIKVSVVQPGPIKTGMKMKKGSYYSSTNPYPPLPDIDLTWESIESVSNVIGGILKNPNPRFRYQTSPAASELVAKYVTDPSGDRWLTEQLKWLSLNN